MLRWIFIGWFGLLGLMAMLSHVLAVLPPQPGHWATIPVRERRAMTVIGILGLWAGVGALRRIPWTWWSALAIAVGSVLWDSYLHFVRKPRPDEEPLSAAWRMVRLSTLGLEVAVLALLLSSKGRAAFAP